MRRKILRALGVGIVPFAGCGNQTEPPATQSETALPTDSPTDTPTEPPTETEPPVRDQTCDTGWDPAVRWSIRTGDCAFEPAVEDGTVYFGDLDHLRAVDAESGDVNWKVEQPSPVLSRQPLVKNDTGVFSNSTHVVGIDVEGGGRVSSFDPPGEIASVTAVADAGATCYIGANQHPGTEQEVDEEYDRVYGSIGKMAIGSSRRTSVMPTAGSRRTSWQPTGNESTSEPIEGERSRSTRRREKFSGYGR